MPMIIKIQEIVSMLECEKGERYNELKNKPTTEPAGEKELEEMIVYLNDHPKKDFGMKNLYFPGSIKNGLMDYIYKTTNGKWRKGTRNIDGLFNKGDFIAFKT